MDNDLFSVLNQLYEPNLSAETVSNTGGNLCEAINEIDLSLQDISAKMSVVADYRDSLIAKRAHLAKALEIINSFPTRQA